MHQDRPNPKHIRQYNLLLHMKKLVQQNTQSVCELVASLDSLERQFEPEIDEVTYFRNLWKCPPRMSTVERHGRRLSGVFVRLLCCSRSDPLTTYLFPSERKYGLPLHIRKEVWTASSHQKGSMDCLFPSGRKYGLLLPIRKRVWTTSSHQKRSMDAVQFTFN